MRRRGRRQPGERTRYSLIVELRSRARSRQAVTLSIIRAHVGG